MNLTVKQTNKISGEVIVPGDKSISHRAVMLGALAEGTTTIDGFLMGADCLSTINCFRALGIPISVDGNKVVVIGGGKTGFCTPDTVLDTGNSGTTTRLIMGILASEPGLYAVLNGDSSLNGRPMGRVTKPLTEMGAEIYGRAGGTMMPVTIRGHHLKAIEYQSPVASAQVKSALLLAGLRAQGKCRYTEPSLSRDHTENMLEAFGADLTRSGTTVELEGGQVLTGQRVQVPGDISSAAFLIVAALIVPQGHLLVKNVGINVTRSGIIEALLEMGADIQILNRRFFGREEVADLEVKSSSLRAAQFGGSHIPRMIDEIPALAVAALTAKGKTIIKDAQELRVKESDRISALAVELKKFGAVITERPDGIEIIGGRLLQGSCVSSHQDHRLAMSLAMAGLIAQGTTKIEGAESVTVSFPDFTEVLKSISEAS